MKKLTVQLSKAEKKLTLKIAKSLRDRKNEVLGKKFWDVNEILHSALAHGLSMVEKGIKK